MALTSTGASFSPGGWTQLWPAAWDLAFHQHPPSPYRGAREAREEEEGEAVLTSLPSKSPLSAGVGGVTRMVTGVWTLGSLCCQGWQIPQVGWCDQAWGQGAAQVCSCWGRKVAGAGHLSCRRQPVLRDRV